MTVEGVTEATIQEMLDDLVVRGADDWVMLSELGGIVTSEALRHDVDLPPSERITVGVEIVRRVLERGFMTPGSVGMQPPGFVPWNVDPATAIEQIDRAWRVAGENLAMGDVCWLANTPDGDVYAERVRQEVNARVGWPPSNE